MPRKTEPDAPVINEEKPKISNANMSELETLIESQLREAQKKREWRTFIIQIICVMAAVYLLLSFVIGIAIVHGDSMEPNVYDGDIALLWRLDRNYKYGNIVFFESKGAAEILVKRIIGVPGDTIEIDDSTGAVIINNVILFEHFVFSGTYTRPGGTQFPLTLGKDEYFCLGDNREISKDSREASVGVVKREDIIGRVLVYTRTVRK